MTLVLSVSTPAYALHVSDRLVSKAGRPHDPLANSVMAELRFAPEIAHEAEAFGQVIETVYSPWMVAPDAIHAPSVLVGGMCCEQGFLPYSFDAPLVPDDQVLKGAWQSQHRPNR